tara:strand:+ start:1738 stop:2679 length:942 start_codon:yes stop_codon:yes gene_type:complete
MTSIFWGGKLYGKVNMQCLFRYNRKTVIQNASHKYKSFKWEYNGNQQIRSIFYKKKDNNDISTKLKIDTITDKWLLETQTDKGLKNNTDCEFDWLGKGRFSLSPDKLKKIKNDKGEEILYEPEDLHPLYGDNIKTWYDHFINDFMSCDLYNPLHWMLDQNYKPYIDTLKKCRNVVGYKENMHDWLVGLLGSNFEPWRSSITWGVHVTDPHDAYKKNPEILFSHFDHHIKQNRNVEQKLNEHGIEYEYLNLDKDDYAKFFNLDRNLERTAYNRVQFYKEIAPDRWDIANNIVSEYIQDRNLTGWKLEGRIHDRI